MILDKDFLSSISTALYDADISSNLNKRPILIYNDVENGRKVLTSILSAMENSTEVAMGVAFATKSGVASIINRLIELEEKKIPCRILVSQYQNFTQPEALRALKQFSNVDLRIAVNGIFHAKGYFFRRSDGYFDIYAGSSNLTASALTTNTEWNLKITAGSRSELLLNVLDVFRIEFSKSMLVTDEFIEQYTIVYEKQIRTFNLSKEESYLPDVPQQKSDSRSIVSDCRYANGYECVFRSNRPSIPVCKRPLIPITSGHRFRSIRTARTDHGGIIC